MNCTKFIPPLPIFVNFYYYYSYLTLILSLIITPLQFYIILTKSKNLKSFKWLILNHSIWCIAWEIYFTTFKPIFLPPASAGFPLNLLRNGSFFSTAIATYIGVIILVNSFASLGATIINRYLLAFPTTLTKWFNLKIGALFTVCVLFVAYVAISFIILPYFASESSVFYKFAVEFDSCMKDFFSEPGFIFMPYEKVKNALFVMLFILFFCLLIGISLIIFFVYLIKTRKTLTIAKLQRSLIISAIVQASLTFNFLTIPLTIFVAVLSFQISSMENAFCVLFCIIATHSLVESIATLYFVTPYRKGVSKLFSKIFVSPSAHIINIKVSTTVLHVHVSSATVVTF